MQRRLTIALVGVALASVVLVGAGVLLFAQVGARSDATAAVVDQLGALRDIVGPETELAAIEPAIRRIGNAFGNPDVGVVWIDDTGVISQIPARGPGRGPGPVTDLQSLTGDDVASLNDGEIVLIDRRRSVVGLVAVGAELRTGRNQAGTAALVVEQGVGTVSARARTWFLTSATAVLIASALVAAWLARRFTAPLRSIEQATATIAAGHLDTRIPAASDDEFGQLARSVNAMAADLERSRAAEQQFLLSVTHDLRTPLTTITGYAEALQDGAIEDPSSAGRIIGSNAERLNRLVGDLLTLARLEGHAFDFDVRTIDPRAVVTEVIEGIRSRAAEADLTVAFTSDETDATIDADAHRLAQIIANVIDNAIKYADTTISVGLRAAQGQVTISVADDGPGIPEPDLPFVFERLYVTQLEPKRAESSSGLGLAIVRELTEGMGGRVSAGRPPSGHGTEMVIMFPRRT